MGQLVKVIAFSDPKIESLPGFEPIEASSAP